MENEKQINEALRTKHRNKALRIAIIYVVVSALWILFSDKLLLTNPATAVAVSTLKGWIYTAVIGVFLYWIIVRELNQTAHEEIGRKKAENALENSEEQLRMTLEATQIATWDWDIQDDVWRASSQYFMMTGDKPESGPMTHAALLRRVHPDDQEVVSSQIKRILDGHDGHFEYEVRMLYVDGSYKWHHVLGHVVERDEGRRPSRMLGVEIDVTKRKEEELSLKKKFDEIEKINKAMVGRELKMVEYKKEIESLREQLAKK